MVIRLVIMYLFGIICLAIFPSTKRYLNSQDGTTVSLKEKFASSLNFMSFSWMIVNVFMLSFNVFFAFRTPVDRWPSYVEFLNEAFSYNPIFSVFMLSFATIVLLVAGYNYNPKASYLPVNAVRYRWLLILIVLYIIVGYAGVITGILV